MSQLRLLVRFCAVSLAATAFVLPAAGHVIAADLENVPFDLVYAVPEASLDTMRGGFEALQGTMVPFGIDMHFDVVANGKQATDVMISNGNNKNSPVTVSETGIGVVNVVMPGQTVTTSLTDHGIMTVIQNVRSNTSLHTVQMLNATVTGMGDLIRTTARNNMHRSRVLFH